MKNIRLIALVTSSFIAAPSIAQNGAASNHDTIRKMFPVIGMFDKKKPVADSGTMPRNELRNAEAVSSGERSRFDAFDVGGLKIGMSIQAAESALQAKHYIPQIVKLIDRKLTFASQVDEAHHNLDQRFALPPQKLGISGRSYLGEGGQNIYVGYAQSPNGPVVNLVTYSVSLLVVPPERIRQDAIKKYGQPNHKDGDERFLWCEGPCNAEPSVKGRMISLTTFPNSGSRSAELSLSDGDIQQNTLSKQIQEEASKLVRSGTGLSF